MRILHRQPNKLHLSQQQHQIDAARKKKERNGKCLCMRSIIARTGILLSIPIYLREQRGGTGRQALQYNFQHEHQLLRQQAGPFHMIRSSKGRQLRKEWLFEGFSWNTRELRSRVRKHLRWPLY